MEGLFNSLDPNSLTQHIALYKLFPEHPSAQKALNEAEKLLTKATDQQTPLKDFPLSFLPLETFLSINPNTSETRHYFSDKQLQAIETLCQNFPNRKLKGHSIESADELTHLPPEEIDLARALFVASSDEEEIDWDWVKNYEAELDLIALQVIAKLPKNPSAEQIIDEMNRLIFFQMHYRFPAMTSLQQESDTFSSLHTVMDQKKGVCLGVSLLYLSLSQRIGLPLQSVIPPGHIFVRYRGESELINIETTARGIHMPSSNYLDVNTLSLKEANLKEVIGFVFFNLAATELTKNQNFEAACKLYEKCLLYAPNHSQALELLGYSYALSGQESNALKCFEQLDQNPYSDRITSIYFEAYDQYRKKEIGRDALKVLLTQAETQTHQELLDREDSLLKILHKYPKFKAGHFFLAETYQALSQPKKAIEILEKLHGLKPQFPYVEFSLTYLHFTERNYSKAWHHFASLKSLLNTYDHHPKIVSELKRALSSRSMQP